MRAFLVLAAHIMAAPAIRANIAYSTNKADTKCQRTSMHVADQIGAYRGKSLTPQKLGQLPPAVTYMAVYRQIGGCEAPLTLSDYRQTRRR